MAIETTRGLLVASLRATGRPMYAINPLAVSRYRERHTVTLACTPAGRESFSRRVSAAKAAGRLAHVLARTRLASPLGRPRAYSRASQPP